MASVLKSSTSTLLSKLARISSQTVRYRRRDGGHRRRPHEYEFLTGKELYPDAPRVQTGNLKYYPRDPNYQDPPYEPTKLLMVKRVKPMKGNPHWDVKVLTRLGLDSWDSKHVVIMKNTEYITEDLWKIKHLVKITPITFPNGEPTEEDIERTIVTEDGRVIVDDSVRPDPNRVEGQENFQKDPLRLDGKFVKNQLLLRWIQGWN